MLQFFRNMIKRPLGLAILGIVIFAFIVTLYEGRTGAGGGLSGDAVAKVGGDTIGENEVARRAQLQLDALQQQPQGAGVDMAAFVAQGGVDQVVNLLVDAKALVKFAADHGLVASDKLIDGLIASLPAFAGPDGKFDQTTFDAVLAQRRLTKAQVREDFAVEATQRMLLTPAVASLRLPQGMIDHYAQLLLEVREGQIAIVPAGGFVDNAPISDADLTSFYSRNIARYTVPERRVIKYALFNKDVLGAAAKATEAEIAAAYQRNSARFGARELRAFTQIIVPREADARALLARVKGGATMQAAAASLGLEPLTVPLGGRAAFEGLTSKAVADAAFAAPRGDFAAVTRSGLGFHVVRVDNISQVAGTSLEAARPQLVAEIEKTKAERGLADLVARMDDAINDGATFDEVAKQFGLTASATPAVTQGGVNPDDSAFRIAPAVQSVLRDAFQAETGDDAQVSAVTAEPGTFVLYDLDRVVPAAAPPLAKIRQQVDGDARIDRAVRASKRIADGLVAALDKGTPFAQAIAASGVKLPPVQPARGTRLDATRDGAQMPAPVRALFSLTERKARVVPMDGNVGWFVVQLARIVPGDPAQAKPLVGPVANQLTRAASEEYTQQFIRAMRSEVGVTIDSGRVAAVKRSLTGGTAGR